jgi:hypothetical protein
MTRREFLRAAIASSLYFAARRVFPANLVARPEVGIAVGTDYERAVTKAIDLLGGIMAFVTPGPPWSLSRTSGGMFLLS